MTYRKLFDPDAPLDDASGATRSEAIQPDAVDPRPGDRTAERVYVYDDDIVLAVNVALATGRPLLVSGEPGTGKTSLAQDVAQRLGWRYYELAITSRTQGQDLLWKFDAVRRLSDAQASYEGQRLVKEDSAYVEPGVLWWAFHWESAGTFAEDPQKEVDSEGAVVLLDEIDKADPDVPNNLLGALGSYEFRVQVKPVDILVRAKRPPLVVLTTNDERELPRAFLRRCVSLTLEAPGKERLLEIARAHFPNGSEALFDKVADELFAIRQENERSDRKLPAIAEYLDAVRACERLELAPNSPSWLEHWAAVAEATLAKRRDIPGGGA